MLLPYPYLAIARNSPARGRALALGGLAASFRLVNFLIHCTSWRGTGPPLRRPGWGRGYSSIRQTPTPVAARVSRQLLQMGDSLWEKTGYDVGVGVKSLVFLALGKHVYPWEELSKL